MKLASFITLAGAASGPVILLTLGLLPAAWLNRHPLRTARLGSALAGLAALGALLAALGRSVGGPAVAQVAVAGPVSLGLYCDTLSVLILVLVAFLLAVVSRFAVNYLAGDPGQGRFTKWLAFTGGSVLAMIVSGNLLQFAVFWSATSLGLHQLLLFYPHRPGAVLAARKKFLISRLGDLCLLAVLILVWQGCGTWDLDRLFALAHASAAGAANPGHPHWQWIGAILVAGAMMKSAQFPFHSWLPDTMETPTPVSALMHAGIINAGGFLVLRLAPVVTLAPAAMSVLAVVGAFTALFASLVMLTHASVKRSLAFSTVAQMGFMMLECGLGAFGLATLHLMAHSLYKAHAFLTSGSIIRLAQSAWVPTGRPQTHPFTLGLAFAAAGLLVGICGWCLDGPTLHHPAGLVLAITFAMALAYALWNLWSAGLDSRKALLGTLAGGGLTLVYFGWHRLFGQLVTGGDWENSQFSTGPGGLVLALITALFLATLVVQTELPQWADRPFFRALYVHARNGFYFNTLANRVVAALWPARSGGSKSHS
jgi:NAD(P)H-quinone oxidoreductase subunit 5